MKQKFYRLIASALDARANCERTGNAEWYARHLARIVTAVKEYAPSGSGFDSGTQFDVDASKPDRLVFNVAFHHMNDGGFYDGWTSHNVIVSESLLGLEIHVTGRDRNGIKEYIADTFYHLGSLEIES